MTLAIDLDALILMWLWNKIKKSQLYAYTNHGINDTRLKNKTLAYISSYFHTNKCKAWFKYYIYLICQLPVLYKLCNIVLAKKKFFHKIHWFENFKYLRQQIWCQMARMQDFAP